VNAARTMERLTAADARIDSVLAAATEVFGMLRRLSGFASSVAQGVGDRPSEIGRYFLGVAGETCQDGTATEGPTGALASNGDAHR
jgi:hypothetical protein